MNDIIITLVVVVICFGAYYFWQKHLRSRAQSLLKQSNGTFDDPAIYALEKLRSIQNPTPQDHFITARLIDLNAHEGRINNIRVLGNVVNKYMTNLQEDNRGNVDDLDWFELDQIENFAERHMDIMAANPNYTNFIEAVLEKRPKKVSKTVEQAKRDSETRAGAFDTYVNSNLAHTDDTQNVHDSAVNEQLRTTLKKLKSGTKISIDENELVTDIENHIDKQFTDTISDINDTDSGDIDENATEKRNKKNNALLALHEMQSDKYNSTLGCMEKDLVKLVWNRAELPQNKERKGIIKDAIVESFADMSNGGGLVCSSGRCARLLESLVHTDSDQHLVSGAMTVEQIRNDALQESNSLLHDSINGFEKGVDKGLAQVAKSYKDPLIVVLPDDEKRFKNIVKDRVTSFLTESYADKLSTRDFSNIRDHCITAIESI